MKNKVLVVDDNPKNLQVVAALLSEKGYLVEVANSGETALIWLKDNHFDAILLDVMMPGLDGYETCRAIKADPKNKNLPVIFLTARHDIEGLSEGFESGGVDYITKPFNEKELSVRLATHIELKQSRQKLEDVNQWLEQEVAKKTHDLQVANKALTAANEKLKKLDDAKNDFLKSISHEIRTPLNGIVGSLNLLKDYDQDDYFQELVNLLDTSVTNLEKYSYAALQIANLQLKGESQLGFQPLDLVALSKTCMQGVMDQVKNKGIQLQFEACCEEIMIEADFSYLQDALIALLECCISFTHEGYVKMSIQCEKEQLKIQLEDTGNLFSGNEVSHFFDSISNQNYTFERNNAMELYLSKIIVQLHNGNLSFKNKADRSGTETIIVLPVNR
jgi:two-component system sensor histidine kinase/response regulator